MNPAPSLRQRFATRFLGLERRVYFALNARATRRAHSQALRAGARPVPPHLLTGQRGEDEAFFYFRRLGYTIVARRWRSDRLRGDLDLVAWDGPSLVFVEVKTLTAADRSAAFAPAEAQVDRDKQNTLRRMASAYLRQLPEPHRDRVPFRFDVVSVYLQANRPPVFDHLRDAFSAVG